MTKKQVKEIINILIKQYPDAKCSLNFSTPFELAIAVMLSAQCTDERVNKTTPELFSKYKSPSNYAEAPILEIENIIRPCGFHKTKASNIKNLAQIVHEQYNDELPSNMSDLMKLPGIGKKSANVIMLDAFNNPQGIAVDTHVKRISNRIGLSTQSTPDKIETDLLNLVSIENLKDVNHIFILHGRSLCKAQSPNCVVCPIKKYCKYYKCNIKDGAK